MNFPEYQEKAATFAVYPPENERRYLSAGIRGEVGEIYSVIAKQLRGDILPEDAMKKECGDVLWFTAVGCKAMGIGEAAPSWLPGDDVPTPAEVWLDALLEHVITFSACLIAGDDKGHLFWAKHDAGCILHCLEKLAGAPIAVLMQSNIDKLSSRQQRGQLKGSGDER